MRAGGKLSLDNNLLEIFSIFLTVGGLGFVNYFILSRMDRININKHNKEDKPLFLILFSLLNYTIYLASLYVVVEGPLKISNAYLSTLISILLTLIITVFLSFTLFSWLSSEIKEKINKNRKGSGISHYDSLTVKQRVFNFSASRMIYIYNLSNQLIDCGYSGWFSSLEDDDFELSLIPFDGKSTVSEYQEVLDYINRNKLESDVYLNFDKNVKIVVIY